MTWAQSAADLLTAANGATLTSPVARSFVAPGSRFARDCRLLAVVLDPIEAAPLTVTDLPGGSCAVVPVLNLAVHFFADCVPALNDQGKPPPADAVTAWVADFHADVEAIWKAVVDAALGMPFGEYDSVVFGDCRDVTVGTATLTGPSGGGAEMRLPVRLTSS